MFCKKCGNKIGDSVSFCVKCGTKINDQVNKVSGRANFYSADWTRKKIFAIASLPYYDVMVDDNYIYLIKLPKYSGAATGLILGLILANILGAFIGSSIGSSSDTKKRKKYREGWIDSGQRIISQNFEKDVFLKIPINGVKKLLTLEKHRITYIMEGEKIVLQKNKQEVERLNNYLSNVYVL